MLFLLLNVTKIEKSVRLTTKIQHHSDNYFTCDTQYLSPLLQRTENTGQTLTNLPHKILH